MTKQSKRTILILSILVVTIIGGIYFAKSFFNAFAPPDLTITKDYIVTNRDFVNGVTIEKIKVDSIGDKGYPIKYTTLYTTSCNIEHPTNKPPDPPSKIDFFKPGKYWWNEDTIKIRYVHTGLTRQPLDSISKTWWLNQHGKLSTCPLKLEKEQWYFITIGDPQVTGLFFYIDKNDEEHQHFLASGVSPI